MATRNMNYPAIFSYILLLKKFHNWMKLDIPAVFFTAISNINTRALLSTHWLTSTWCILLARLVFPISNSFPYWWVASRLPGIFKLPCFAPFPQQPWPRCHILVLTWKHRFKEIFWHLNSGVLIKVGTNCQNKNLHNKFNCGKLNLHNNTFLIFKNKNPSIHKGYNTRGTQKLQSWGRWE